jgi:hypothetical protein
MGVSPCSRCDKCGSDFAQGPNEHEEPALHEYVTKYDQNTGKPYEICRRCMEHKPVPCRACGAPLNFENRVMADGCPCNSGRGVNHDLVPKNVCSCVECDPAQTGSSRHR